RVAPSRHPCLACLRLSPTARAGRLPRARASLEVKGGGEPQRCEEQKEQEIGFFATSQPCVKGDRPWQTSESRRKSGWSKRSARSATRRRGASGRPPRSRSRL